MLPMLWRSPLIVCLACESFSLVGSAAAAPLPDDRMLALPLRTSEGCLIVPLEGRTRGEPPADLVRSLPLETVAEIDPELFQQMVFGDTDHDGRTEAFLYVNDHFTFHYRILEEQGGNLYALEYQGDPLLPYATGDLDGDGLMELIGQEGAKIYVYESPAPDALPTRRAWSSPDIINVLGYSTIGDTDRDGRMEIVHSLNPLAGNSELLIFESTGNDALGLVYRTVVGPGANGEKVLADLDGDGRIEIAMCGLVGDVYVYESAGDNVWARTWTATTGLWNAYGAEGGVDTDGNGRPEFLIMGNGPNGWTTIVFEAIGDNAFLGVQELAIDDGFGGMSCNALGQLDAIGGPEYLMQGSGHFWIYHRQGHGPWALAETVVDPVGGLHFGLQTYDANRNGRDEVFWDIEGRIEFGGKALVLEYTPDPAGLPENMPGNSGKIRILPNPVTGRALVAFAGERDRSLWLVVLDAQGRRVSDAPLSGGTNTWDTSILRSGPYFLRVEDAQSRALAVGRALVLR